MTPHFTVIGATGYIGSRLVNSLRAQGYNVWTPERPMHQLASQALGHVIYCAGLTGNFRTRPFDTIEAHITLLAQILKESDFDSLLYLSSTRVYLGSTRTDEEAPLSAQPLDPSYLYNLSKLTGESLCVSSGRSNVRIARLSNIIGPGMSTTSGNLLADLVSQAHQGHITLRSHPESCKDYLHIDDAIHYLKLISLSGKKIIYNVASGSQTSHHQWLQWLSLHTHSTLSVDPQGQIQSFESINTQQIKTEFPFIRKSIFDIGLLDIQRSK